MVTFPRQTGALLTQNIPLKQVTWYILFYYHGTSFSTHSTLYSIFASVFFLFLCKPDSLRRSFQPRLPYFIAPTTASADVFLLPHMCAKSTAMSVFSHLSLPVTGYVLDSSTLHHRLSLLLAVSRAVCFLFRENILTHQRRACWLVRYSCTRRVTTPLSHDFRPATLCSSHVTR